MPRSKKTEAINILESYITNNPDMALFVKGILRMSIANAFIQKKKTITEQEKEKGKKVNKKRPNDFWTNIAALVIWIFFFILIAAGAVIGYQFYEESGLFFGALIGAIVGGIIVCFTMVLLEISKNNAKQVELNNRYPSIIKILGCFFSVRKKRFFTAMCGNIAIKTANV